MEQPPRPYRLTVLQDYFTSHHQERARAVDEHLAEEEAIAARHAANRNATLDIIALRHQRNILGKLVDENPNTFALVCVMIYVSYSFWHWWLTSPSTQIMSAPLRDALRGIGW